LAHLSPYEYKLGSVVIKKTPKNCADARGADEDGDSGTDDDGDGAADGHVRHGAGRPCNITFPFDPRHPLFKTHVQRSNSKIPCPIFACPPPPKPPPQLPPGAVPTKAWLAKESAHARFYVAIFRPWNTVTGEADYVSVEAYQAFMVQLRRDAAPAAAGAASLEIYGGRHNTRRGQRQRPRLPGQRRG
jgi:hypothetical protein